MRNKLFARALRSGMDANGISHGRTIAYADFVRDISKLKLPEINDIEDWERAREKLAYLIRKARRLVK